MTTDLRGVTLAQSKWNTVTRCIVQLTITLFLFIIGIVAVVTIPPDDKVIYKDRTVTEQVMVAEPAANIPIGRMTAAEFNYITRDMRSTHISDMFGIPPGNVDGDFKTIYPAASGGRYIVYFYDKDVDNSDYDKLVVKSKEYKR